MLVRLSIRAVGQLVLRHVIYQAFRMRWHSTCLTNRFAWSKTVHNSQHLVKFQAKFFAAKKNSRSRYEAPPDRVDTVWGVFEKTGTACLCLSYPGQRGTRQCMHLSYRVCAWNIDRIIHACACAAHSMGWWPHGYCGSPFTARQHFHRPARADNSSCTPTGLEALLFNLATMCPCPVTTSASRHASPIRDSLV